ncbi:hypothetical protein EKH55_3819 [Sinorhizobium alkalisoli]|nr:hypothetical protein EKH55_3819 [Sinorhizobium alkalisoli]
MPSLVQAKFTNATPELAVRHYSELMAARQGSETANVFSMLR